jgi:hypothetical protein
VIDTFLTAKPDDEHLEALIREYDRRGVMSRTLVSQMLLAEHNIQMRYIFYPLLLIVHSADEMFHSSATVARRRKNYNLKGSGKTTSELPLPVKRQLVLDEMAEDPTSRKGPKTIMEGIGFKKSIHLTRYDADHPFSCSFTHIPI